MALGTMYYLRKSTRNVVDLALEESIVKVPKHRSMHAWCHFEKKAVIHREFDGHSATRFVILEIIKHLANI